MSNHTSQTGGPLGADRTTDHEANFKPDFSTRLADAEQGNAVGTNQHAGGSKPSGIEKAGGKVEQMLGKAIGDGELEAKGRAVQGNVVNAEQQQGAATEQGGELSYADRIPNK